MTHLTLRPAQPEPSDIPFGGSGDGAFLYSLFREERAAVFRAGGLDGPPLEQILRMQFIAQWRDWQRRFPRARFDLVYDGQTPIGRLFVDRGEREIRLIDITLTTQRRGQGIGAELIRRVLEEAREVGLPVTLHVEHHNPARRLYQRLGFRETGHDELRAVMEWRA